MKKRIVRGALMVWLWLVAEASLHACPVCFQIEDGPVTDGVRAAVFVLVSVTTSVLLGFAVFISGFVRRDRALANQNPGTSASSPREAPGPPTRQPRWGGRSESASAGARASGGGAPRAVSEDPR